MSIPHITLHPIINLAQKRGGYPRTHWDLINSPGRANHISPAPTVLVGDRVVIGWPASRTPRPHAGVDVYTTPTDGVQVLAPFDAQIHRSAWLSPSAGYGVELVQHVTGGTWGFTSVHLAAAARPRQGARVRAGDPIGRIGARADIPAYIGTPHTHIQIHWITSFNPNLRVNSQGIILDPLALGALTERQTVSRYAGRNRYDTARLLAVDTFDAPVDLVLIVLGETWTPDAVVAGSAGVPVLLVRRDSIPAETVSALNTLRPKSIRIVGGEAVVAANVAAELAQYATG